ncbi:MAG: type IV pilus assembly protein PilM [Halobacteriovoraceae bacterium]|nr:type IV pilus assembly protein PilM [Halobacteriovoraceae bacterium]
MSIVDEIISKLGSSQLVGVDIGQNAVKVCQLSKSGKRNFSMKAFSFTPLSESAIFEEEISKRDEVIDAIFKSLGSAGIRSKEICFGYSGSNCIVKSMKAPEAPDDEIRDYVNWEAEQFIPFGIENAEISVHIMEKSNEENRDVVMAAAKISDLENYEELFKAAGLKLKTIDLQVLSLINVFEYSYAEHINEYRNGTLIIDFGAQSTKVVVYKDGIPLLTKSIILGGINATEDIQKEIGLDFAEAEELKRSKTDDNNYPSEILDTVHKHVNKLLQKIKDAIAFYTASNSDDRIYHCFVTGGSLQLPGVIEGLSEMLDLSVEILDPMRKVDIKKNLPQGLVDYITYCGAVSIGLAMRNFD